MRRILFLAVAVLGVAALQSPAEANNAGGIWFQGTATVGAGFGGYCVGAVVTPDPTKCPILGLNGNQVGFTFRGTGAGYVAKARKPKCNTNFCIEVGTYNISANGSLRGWCEEWSGSMSGTISPAVSLGTKANTRSFSASLSAEGDNVVISGSTSQGEAIFGHATWVPDSSTGSSCTNKNAKSFIVAGKLYLVR